MTMGKSLYVHGTLYPCQGKDQRHQILGQIRKCKFLNDVRRILLPRFFCIANIAQYFPSNSSFTLEDSQTSKFSLFCLFSLSSPTFLYLALCKCYQCCHEGWHRTQVAYFVKLDIALFSYSYKVLILVHGLADMYLIKFTNFYSLIVKS